MVPVTEQAKAFKQRAKKEIGLFLGLLFIGLVVVPFATFLVGEQFFGAYGGHGYSDFYGTISGKIRTGDVVAWFLILSPYLAWQTARLTAFGWKIASHGGGQTSA
jgi:hypothetical protein